MSGMGSEQHLSEEELADLVNRPVAGKAAAHLEACSSCRIRLAEAAEAWRLAAAASMPEPSPLYWQAFPRQVRRGLETRERRRRRFFLAPTLAAAGALALALALREPAISPTAIRPEPLPAWTPLPEPELDDGWLALEGLLRHTGDLGAVTSCADVGECLAGLSDEDTAALEAALRRDLEGEEL